MNINPKLLKLTIAALMAAIIFAVTFAVRIPVPFASGGYLNIGDAPIYIAAWLLGGPVGALAAGIGSALSDLIAGYAIYVPATAIIKGLMGFACGKLVYGKGFGRFLLGSVLGGGIMVAGYAVFEFLMFNANQAIGSIPFNAIQWAGGVVVACALFPVVRSARQLQGVLGASGRNAKGKDQQASGLGGSESQNVGNKDRPTGRL